MTSTVGSSPEPGSARTGVLRRLSADRGALAAALALVLIALACALAPVYAARVSGTDPFRSNPLGTDRRGAPVLADNTAGLGLGTTPLGPTGRGDYLLGADAQGRDLAARVLHGGRTSLLIASSATALCLALAAVAGVAAGFAGGAADAAASWLLDLLWAFPVTLLAISLSLVLVSQGIRLGPVTLESDSLALPALILGVVYVPYVARPVRAQVRLLARSEFVQAAASAGAGPGWVLFRHILPHAAPTLIGFVPVVMALVLLTEAALSAASVGVQAPAASWGTLIADGQALLYTRPLVAIAPGLAVVATVLALNVLADGVRDALDPRG